MKDYCDCYLLLMIGRFVLPDPVDLVLPNRNNRIK